MAVPLTHNPRAAARNRILTVTFCLVAAVVLAVAGCSSDEADAASDSSGGGGPGAGMERPPPGVQVAIAEARPLERRVEFTGELLADDLVMLSPQESGRVVELLVDEGDEVEADQLIGQLDDDLQRRAVREADARLDSARARLSQAEAQREQQTNEVERRRPLAERNAFPEAQLAQLEDAVLVAEQAVAVAEAQVEEARAARAAAREALDRREIRAPFAGLITERHVSQGAVVSPQAPVVTVVDLNSLRFVFPLSEQRVASVSQGTEASVVFDAYPDQRVPAHVWRVGRVIDRDSRTVDVKLVVEPESPDIVLRHGMFGRGRLVAERLDSAIVISPEALQTTREGTQRVWTVTDGEAQPADVTIALATEDAVAVEGVEAGSQVILAPPMGLTPGGRVYVVGGGAIDTETGTETRAEPGDAESEPPEGTGTGSEASDP